MMENHNQSVYCAAPGTLCQGGSLDSVDARFW